MRLLNSDIPVMALFKRFVIIFLPVAALFSLALFLAIRFDIHSRTTSAIAHEQSRAEIARGRVVRDMSVVTTDLRVITHLALLQEYLNSGSPMLKKKLESVFLDFARETHRYDQIRYLDSHGEEVVRINYNNGSPSVVPEDRLQNKFGRYYFDDTFKLGSSEIFVSPLDLNIEHGKVEIPYKPMIRFGMPVFDSAGHKKGIILLNYFGQRLLEGFRAVMSGDIPHRSMLLNSDGYWLSSSHRDNEWGFMLGKKLLTFGHAFPEAWKIISTQPQGSLLTQQGLFVFTTALPLSKLGATYPDVVPSKSDEYHWKIVSFISRDVLFGSDWYNQNISRLLIALTYLLLALASYLVASIVLRRQMARKEIERLNVELEQRVEERTASEENLSVTLNSIGDAVIATDTEGRITRLNNVAEQLTGWSRADALGQPVEEIFRIINQKTREPAPIPVAATLKEGIIHGLANDTILIARNGHEYPIADSCAPIRHISGEIIGAVLVFRDVTQEYAAQAALVAAKDKAELANRAKDSFLSTMSHEIRTPLSGMLGMLEVLSLSKLDSEQNKTLQAAWDSGKSLLRIVSDILDWSKIEEGKLSIVPRSTSIPQLMQEVVNTYSRVASAKNLRLAQETDARIGPAHLVDALRLSQVLNNFVSNAIKFTKRGEIGLHAELLEQVESGERIRFSVRDTGIGIAKDAQRQLFQRYRQGSEDTTRLYGGTGLGLAICRRLTDMMDGQIELESEPGRGSTFSITLTLPVSGAPGEALPSQQPEIQQKQIAPLFPEDADAPTILVVDDHPINRDLMSRQIHLLGLRVETAENGEIGVGKWRDGQFALVITDCHMPELDGYGLSRAIRETEAKKQTGLHTPIIGWTANAVGDEAGLCHAAGMDDLLIKPTNMKDLRASLAKWLDIPEPDEPTSAPSPGHVDGAQAGPIDFAELEKVVPDRTEHIQVLQDFLEHVRTDRTTLTAMLEQGDQTEVTRTAHRMKGSSRMVGAKEMAEVCASIEQAAKAGNMNDVQSALAGLDDAIDRLGACLRGGGHG